MEFEKIFIRLESNQTHENEEAKKKLVEFITQSKEQWPVRYMLDYYTNTGSMRVMEVLVKAQPPHDGYIFDRLDDWLKQQQLRVQALNVLCFIVRRHPTWLHKIEKHRLIKSVFKLLTHEKDIVPLMSALLCIITLLPIIPNSVPNFLNDLFEVFGHLASWKLQNMNSSPDEKLHKLHLQLGLQMLFHRLYGMYPCNFLNYLSDFIKKDKNGIFKHTIRPLLDTVRVHPMLLTATTETEVSNLRWKEMEPHDVVMECAHLSLPVLHPDSTNEDITSAYPCSTPSFSRMTSTNSQSDAHHNNGSSQLVGHRSALAVRRFDSVPAESSNTPIWSPYNEIATAATGSTAIPLTPTAQFILPLQPSSSNTQLLGATGSSPPEAAVEATPETTPLKDLRDFKQHQQHQHQQQQQQQQQLMPNSHAVRAIFVNSQPSSPMRKDQQSQFHFPDVSKSTQSELPELSETLLTTGPNAMQRQIKEIRTTVCGECNETEGSPCSDGGLHMPTSQSVQLLARGFRRRNRMVSYCCNESGSSSGWSGGAAAKKALFNRADNQMRRTKSCSALAGLQQQQQQQQENDETDCPTLQQKNGNGNGVQNQKTVLAGSRLQRSGRMLAMVEPRVGIDSSAKVYKTKEVQTIEVVSSHYEDWLFQLLFECKKHRNNYERRQSYPQDILDQYIMCSIHAKDGSDASSNLTVSFLQDQFQLICLQLQYECYRRGIHAERNRRLMGRSREKRSLEMERDRLREQLKNFDVKNRDLALQMDTAIRQSNERQNRYDTELGYLKCKYESELEQNKCLRQANDDLQTRLNAEIMARKETIYEIESLRGQLFTMSTELQQAQQQADLGLQCKQELARLEAELIIMGEVQVRCRDRLAEIDNYRARDEELQLLQESYNSELKELRHNLLEKTSQLESTKHKISEQQAQLANSEKVIAEQKRLLCTVKDEYEERFKSVNKKYDIQKKIIVQLEEKLNMSLENAQNAVGHTNCSPDTDRTDIASSMERNSPLSTSLASSESLSASLRSTELKNLQQLLETPSIPEVSTSLLSSMTGGTGLVTGVSYDEYARMPAIDLASSAGTASVLHMTQTTAAAALPLDLDLPTTSNHTHTHPHLHLQQQQQQQQDQQPTHSQQ